jgi:hypothetical protein
MQSYEDLIVILEHEASHYPDGSYQSNLYAKTCSAIRSFIQRLEAADELNAELRCSRDGCQAQVKLLREALELNGGKQAKKPGKKKNART